MGYDGSAGLCAGAERRPVDMYREGGLTGLVNGISYELINRVIGPQNIDV